jgi:hypothetical protein
VAAILFFGEVANASTNLVFNGEFAENDDGWTLIDHSPASCNYQSGPGWNGEPGHFFVNEDSGEYNAETNQLVEGLVPGGTYIVSGYYWKEETGSSPEFEVRMDDTTYLSAVGSYHEWLPFEFEYVAEDSDVLLRFVAQLTQDKAYRIDNIQLYRDPAEVPAVSEWGLIAMTLLVLTAGTIVYAKRRPAVS